MPRQAQDKRQKSSKIHGACAGDREAWTGDAHPSQAAALVAFHNLDFIKQNLASSIHGSGAVRKHLFGRHDRLGAPT